MYFSRKMVKIFGVFFNLLYFVRSNFNELLLIKYLNLWDKVLILLYLGLKQRVLTLLNNYILFVVLDIRIFVIFLKGGLELLPIFLEFNEPLFESRCDVLLFIRVSLIFHLL